MPERGSFSETAPVTLRAFGDSLTRGNLPKLAGIAAGGRQAISNAATYSADKYRDLWENLRLAAHGSSMAYNDMLARNFPDDPSVGDWRERADDAMLGRLDLAEQMATRPPIQYRNPIAAGHSANLATQLDMARGLREHPEAARMGYETGDEAINAGMDGIAALARLALQAILFPAGLQRMADGVRATPAAPSLDAAHLRLQPHQLRAPAQLAPPQGSGIPLEAVIAPGVTAGRDPPEDFSGGGRRVVPGETDAELAQSRKPSNPWYIPSPQVEAKWRHDMRAQLARGGDPYAPDKPPPATFAQTTPAAPQRQAQRRLEVRPPRFATASAQEATDQELIDAMQAPY